MVHLRKGFFWYYLDYNPTPLKVEPEGSMPCKSFPVKKQNQHLLRILAKEKSITVEFLHILTDGTGALEFLKTLMLTYFEKLNININDWGNVLKPSDKPNHEEHEDAYKRFFQKKIPVSIAQSKAFHISFELNNKPRLKVINALINADELIKEVKNNNTTVTVYLVSVYLWSLQKIYLNQKKSKKSKIIRVQTPVNLRKIYKSKTMRNFALFIMPEINLSLGEYSFDEIIKTVHHNMVLNTEKKILNKNITYNVKQEKNPFIRIIPLFIKNFILIRAYQIRGTKQYSGVLTNLGKINLPPEAEPLINYFTFIPPPPNTTLRINAGAITFGNNLVISFGNITKSNELERIFLTTLVEKNISVKIFTA